MEQDERLAVVGAGLGHVHAQPAGVDVGVTNALDFWLLHCG